MTRFFLDDNLALPVCVVFAVLALTGVWYVRRTAATTRMLLIGVLLGLALLVVQKVLVTDREAIERTVRRLAVAVEEGQVGEISDAIDASYDADGLDKALLMPLIEATLNRFDVQSAMMRDVRVEVNGDRGTMTFGILCRLRFDGFDRPSTSRWSLTLVRRDRAWKVSAIEPLEIDRQKVPDLRQILRR